MCTKTHIDLEFELGGTFTLSADEQSKTPTTQGQEFLSFSEPKY